MKIIPLFLAVALFYSCASKKEVRQTSKSYQNIEAYLKDIKIDDPGLIYFFSEKPRNKIPNVYAFDSLGRQVQTPGNCFSYLETYIGYLNDSLIPLKPEGQTLANFIDNSKLIDAYDKQLAMEDIGQAHYYLFVDFLVLPIESFKQTLTAAVAMKKKMPRNIKLFLVHALSEHNKKYFPKTLPKDSI